MIVTMMFAQVFYLLMLYFGAWTRGDEGLVIPQQARSLTLGDIRLDLTDPTTRYMAALALFSIVLVVTLAIVRSRAWPRARRHPRERGAHADAGLRHLRQQARGGGRRRAPSAPPRARPMSLLFGYVGSTLASVQYSILPLLWVLLGGAATTLGPLLGTLFMYYVVDITSGYTSAYMLIVGVALILLVLFFPKGMLGTVRDRWARWLP